MATKQEYLDKAFEIIKSNGENLSGPELKAKLTATAKGIADAYGEASLFEETNTGAAPAPACDPKKAIKEKAIVCLVCGQSFKLLTAKHLESHGMTPAEYRAAYGYLPGASLCCKELKASRAAKMKDMKLWERRGKTAENTAPAPAKGKGKGKGRNATAAEQENTSSPVEGEAVEA